MNNAFIMPGGGFKSAGQVGMVQRLLETGIQADAVFGTSGGALVGVLVAMREYDLLYQLYAEVGDTEGGIITKAKLMELQAGGNVAPVIPAIVDALMKGIDIWDKIRLVTKNGRQWAGDRVARNFNAIDSLLDNSPLAEILHKYVKINKVLVPYYCTLVSLHDLSLHKIRHDQFASDADFANGVLASSCMPGIWKPVPEIHLADGTVIFDAVDGGLRMSSPMPLAFEMAERGKPWTFWGMNSNSIKQMVNTSPKNLATQAALSLDIMLNNGLTKDIKDSEKWNLVALECPEFAAKYNLMYATINNVEVPLDADGRSQYGNTLDASKAIIDKRIALGRIAVESFLTAA